MLHRLQQAYRLFHRHIYRPLWHFILGSYAQTQAPLYWEEGKLAEGGFTHQLSAYSCPIINPPSQHHVFQNKIHNLGLALSRMQGLIIQPGEIFSFWHLVGEPNEESGFRPASTLIDNVIVMVVGGGLCQLSGLLYNVALLAGCKILERHAHSIDAYGEGRYIPLGRDATVDYPSVDLCFQNPYDFPIVLVLDVTLQKASGALYATQQGGFEVEIIVSPPEMIASPTHTIIDAALPDGQHKTKPGITGKKVKTWRIIRSNHSGIKREHLSSDTYAPTPTVTRIGRDPCKRSPNRYSPS